MSLKKKSIIGIVVSVIFIFSLFFLGKNTLTGAKTYTVKKGVFESEINVKGEIQGKNAVLITLPDEMKNRDLRIHDFQIKDLVEEGTKVKKGDWVATLDIAAITQQIQDNNDDLEMRRAEFNDAKIDSAIDLTNLREEIKEFKFDLEYKKLELEQSKYESPAYQRKTKVAYNATLRQMDKKRRDYELRKLDLKNRIRRIERRYNFHVKRDSLLKQASIAAQITTPLDGIVMYAKIWGRRKIRVGDAISQWEPTIAKIPDMSIIESETFVEEIQITKVELGDSVEVTVDAIPNKIFLGKISSIANIGQEISGFESKVFRVLIELNAYDPALKPAMSSNNRIIINQVQNVLLIPRKCLFSENGVNFVFLKKAGKIGKRKVETGEENEEEIIVLSGLEEKDKILTEAPEEAEKLEFIGS